MNKIVVMFDYTSKEGLSYVEVLKSIEEQKPIINTNCLDFFSFSYLDNGYDVEVRKLNGDYIILSELLEDENHVYTQRLVRKTHDARKLLIANEFNFKKKDNAQTEYEAL